MTHTESSKKKRTTKIEFTNVQRAWMVEHYSTTKNKYCCDYLGVSMRTMIRFARTLGLVKDPEFVKSISREHCKLMQTLNRYDGNAGKINLIKHGARYRFRKGETTEQRIGTEAWERTKEKIRKKRNETIRRERARIIYGFPQRTKLKLVCNSQAINARYSLRKRGYICDGRGARVAYYTCETDRDAKLEQTAISNGIDIFPAKSQ